ncbi:hypothetical protein CCP3SC5AM1_940007 [Gammaproteobacteria bacterium]
MDNFTISNDLINFIINNAHFDKHNILLFTVKINNDSEFIKELEVWNKKNCKLNFGGLIGIEILNHHSDENNFIFSFKSDYFRSNMIEFKNFIEKDVNYPEFRS